MPAQEGVEGRRGDAFSNFLEKDKFGAAKRVCAYKRAHVRAIVVYTRDARVVSR